MEGDVIAIITSREELITEETELLEKLKRVEVDISERKKEISRMSEQVKYYSSLVKDMKQEMAPSKMDDVYKAI